MRPLFEQLFLSDTLLVHLVSTSQHLLAIAWLRSAVDPISYSPWTYHDTLSRGNLLFVDEDLRQQKYCISSNNDLRSLFPISHLFQA